MKYYTVSITDYELGCTVGNFDDEEALMTYVNENLSSGENDIVLIVKGEEVEIEAKEVIKEWKLK